MLHLRNTCGYYGAERCIVGWIEELSRRGHRFAVAVYDHPDPSTSHFLEAARDAGAEVRILRRSHARALANVVALARLVRSFPADVIHAHDNRSHGIGWLVGGITATPVVGTVHGYVSVSRKSRVLNTFNRSFLGGRRLAALTVPTRLLRAELPEAVLMPNALPAWIAGEPLAAERRPDTPHFGVVARLSGEKGIAVFLDAVGSLPPDWRYTVVGDGPLRLELREHRQAARVEWAGFRPDARRLMRDWSALVVPSLTEGLPITILEAMGQGVPLVASGVGGIPEALADGEAGLLVPPGDPAALASAMREVAEHSAAARARAVAARRRFLEAYTLERAGDELERIYRRVAGRTR